MWKAPLDRTRAPQNSANGGWRMMLRDLSPEGASSAVTASAFSLRDDEDAQEWQQRLAVGAPRIGFFQARAVFLQEGVAALGGQALDHRAGDRAQDPVEHRGVALEHVQVLDLPDVERRGLGNQQVVVGLLIVHRVLADRSLELPRRLVRLLEHGLVRWVDVLAPVLFTPETDRTVPVSSFWAHTT